MSPNRRIYFCANVMFLSYTDIRWQREKYPPSNVDLKLIYVKSSWHTSCFYSSNFWLKIFWSQKNKDILTESLVLLLSDSILTLNTHDVSFFLLFKNRFFSHTICPSSSSPSPLPSGSTSLLSFIRKQQASFLICI